MPASRACRALYPAVSRTMRAPAVQSFNFQRMMMAAAHGLDKKEVTDRVLNCVKNFEKVDHSKVRRVRRSCTQPVHAL